MKQSDLGKSLDPKPLMSLYRIKWRERDYELRLASLWADTHLPYREKKTTGEPLSLSQLTGGGGVGRIQNDDSNKLWASFQ